MTLKLNITEVIYVFKKINDLKNVNKSGIGMLNLVWLYVIF